jgi:CelD/BcsL family acetyltransferase involved in cellulose biosynthesis
MTAGAIRVAVLRERSGLTALEPEWDRLLEAGGGTPFQSHAWATAWLDTMGRDVEPMVATFTDGDRLVGIAPFCRRPDGLITLVGYPQNDYGGFLLDPSAGEGVSAELAALLAGWQRGRHRILVEQLPEGHPAWRTLLPPLAATGVPWSLVPGDPCPAFTIGDPQSARAAYARLGISRWINWLRRRGDLAFSVEETPAGVATRLEALIAQHIERWEGTSTPSPFKDPHLGAFHRAFTAGMAAHGWARMATLTLSGEPLALMLFLEREGVFHLYKASYNTAYRQGSPGKVILHFLLEHAIERGARELDFTRGDEGYKNHFCNLVRRNHHLVIHRTRLEKGLAEARLALARSGRLRAALRKPPLPDQAGG